MTTTAHANCTHPATKGARSHCRSITRTKRIAAAKADALMIAVGDQLAKATELIELNAIVRVRGSIFNVLGSDGATKYITHTDGHCTCPAGLHRFRAVAPTLKNGQPGAEVCYHVLAARVKAASYVAA